MLLRERPETEDGGPEFPSNVILNHENHEINGSGFTIVGTFRLRSSVFPLKSSTHFNTNTAISGSIPTLPGYPKKPKPPLYKP